MKVKRLHTDNAAEYLSMTRSLKEMGIDHTITTAYRAQSNGVAEPMNRSLLDEERAIKKYANFIFGYWCEAVLFSVYLYNRIATPQLVMCTRHEKVFKTATVNDRIRMSGCKAYVHRDNTVRKGKLSYRISVGLYVKIKEGLYDIYLPKMERLINTKNVSFNMGMWLLKRDWLKEQKCKITPPFGLNDVDTSSEDGVRSESGIKMEQLTLIEDSPMDENEQDFETSEEAVHKMMKAARGYTLRGCRPPRSIQMNARIRARRADKPSASDTLKGNSADKMEVSDKKTSRYVTANKLLGCGIAPEEQTSYALQGYFKARR